MKTACQVLLILLAVIKTSVGADAVDLLGQLKAKLPPGWSATRTETGIDIRREKPLDLYNPVSLPDDGDEYLKSIKQPHDYRLRVTCKSKISSEELRRLENENAKTEKEIKDLQDKMRGFWGKGAYTPRTPQQKSLYEDYKARLRTLPFNVLPDGRFGESLVYVESNFPHGYCMFYDARDRFDCLSAIATAFSVIEPVDRHSLRFSWDEKQVSAILWAKRPREIHQREKEVCNLK
jgi:hypothetical protein